jgi:hypothetical protein
MSDPRSYTTPWGTIAMKDEVRSTASLIEPSSLFERRAESLYETRIDQPDLATDGEAAQPQ